MIIDLAVGKSHYKISCQPNEKEKLLHLAESLNQRVNNLSLSLKNADEKTLLLIAALLIEEELQDVNRDEIAEIENHKEEPKLNEQDIYDAVAENMENIADYIEKLTAKIQNY
jgi:cell division protein ZapA (FtsZ GTPase activity inhibitor)